MARKSILPKSIQHLEARILNSALFFLSSLFHILNTQIYRMLEAQQIIDGYRLIRKAGSGGFGEVWVCLLEATAEYRALKYLPEHNLQLLERELEAVIRYRREVSKLQCPYLVPIEHVNRIDRGVIYTMPLADGLNATTPTDPDWHPATLASLIQARRTVPHWFSEEEIVAFLHPIMIAACALNDARIVHRDIKPENILIINGIPSLADFSLLARDDSRLSRRGTPGFVAPSWYLESSGNPDMWGLAVTLYTLATGHPADKLGKAAYLWPPQGEKAIHRATWLRLHQLVLSATHESPSERPADLRAFIAALQAQSPDTSRPSLWRRAINLIRDLTLFGVFTFAGTLIAREIVRTGHPFPPSLAPMVTLLTASAAFSLIGWLTPKEQRWPHLSGVTLAAWGIGYSHVMAGTHTLPEWFATLIPLALLGLLAIGLSSLRNRSLS